MTTVNNELPIKDLESVLQEHIGKKLKIKNLDWKHLTDPGENFGSLILAINLTVGENGFTKKFHLVAKLPPKSDYLLDLFNSPMSFYKEIYFYKVITPEFLQFQLSFDIDKQELIELVPQYFGGRLGFKDHDKFDDQATILLENLKIQGYETEDRIMGMDKKHMLFAIKQLARLHALTIAYKMKKPKEFKSLILPGLQNVFNKESIIGLQDMINKAIGNLNTLKEVELQMPSVIKTMEYGASTMELQPKEPWATLVHSDFWVNNMLFLHDNEKSENIIDMKIVDLQLTQYEDGCLDLIFMIMSSAKANVIDENLDEMIDTYYTSFIDCLKIFHVDVKQFPRDEFDKNIQESAKRRLDQCVMMVQVIQAKRGSARRVDNIKNKENFLDMGRSKENDEKLIHIVKTYEKRGWFC